MQKTVFKQLWFCVYVCVCITVKLINNSKWILSLSEAICFLVEACVCFGVCLMTRFDSESRWFKVCTPDETCRCRVCFSNVFLKADLYFCVRVSDTHRSPSWHHQHGTYCLSQGQLCHLLSWWRTFQRLYTERWQATLHLDFLIRTWVHREHCLTRRGLGCLHAEHILYVPPSLRAHLNTLEEVYFVRTVYCTSCLLRCSTHIVHIHCLVPLCTHQT